MAQDAESSKQTLQRWLCPSLRLHSQQAPPVHTVGFGVTRASRGLTISPEKRAVKKQKKQKKTGSSRTVANEAVVQGVQ
ncbi:hypothetical protein MKX08_008222 [Trichoderma sp. CBMAI-0020]|nr:hypothetical protein MKX08_008222 [Trichoderma sp. CBMAI-0020]WOD46338.1 hypothetical protein [Trichoderma atroviride]